MSFQKGFATTILVLIASVGVIAYTLLSSSLSFQNRLSALIYPKIASQAQESISVSVVNPLDKAILLGNSPTYLTVATSENVGISKVEFYVDSSLVCETTHTPYYCIWQVPPASGTKYQITAKAYNLAGNSASNSITVTAR